ncbi:hypothetical protein [Actinocrispum wychmicini]|uniref:hypothetical protein n=1 Tax=Actinocrispum wychmicini TaxID=1213861 RepID=UPI00104F694F|nr:hypothetical protein [Actinocrispum wychmicini]
MTVLVAAGVLTQPEARQELSHYTVRELCDEIDLRFAELAAHTGDPELIRRELSGAELTRPATEEEPGHKHPPG